MRININKILIGLIIVLLVALLIVISRKTEPTYYAVYLRTGELYFGKLQRFPRLCLIDPYLLRTNVQNPEYPFSIQDFKQVFWGPENKLNLNSSQIVWIAKLKPESQLVKFMEGKIISETPTSTTTPTSTNLTE